MTLVSLHHSSSELQSPGVEVLSVADPDFPVLLVCDHATNYIPDSLNGLGVPGELLQSHIGLDIGAAAICRKLAQLLNVPAVLCRYSRLIVDCNRHLDDPSAFPETSDGVVVPGNQALSVEEREARANLIYWPYHHAVRDHLGELEAHAAAPAVIAIHTFTPELAGHTRPWHLGVLWDKDDRIAQPLMQALRADGDVVVGDNEPYSGRHPADFTLDHHAEAEGLAHVGIEVRQDLAITESGAARCAALLAQVLASILKDVKIYTHRAGTR